MNKTMRAIGVVLSLFAVLAFASPVFACGGGKMKDKTAEKSDKSEEASMPEDGDTQEKSKKAKNEDDEEPS